MAGNSVRFTASIDDKVSAKLGLIRTEFDKLGGPGSSASLFGNVGAKAVAAGFGLIDTAASAVVGVLGDAVNAAIEDEASQAKLGAALKANVQNWDGNTEAIEKVLQARMRLGFSDDEQRDSLALLVAATHSVTKALDLQRVAMDLARFKGISLAAASEALVKVEGGQYRALKNLGIVLKDGATQQDALNAVMKVANGQAEAQANTVGGELLAAQVKYNEAIESLGYELLPVVAAALDALAGATDFLGNAAQGLGDTVADLQDHGIDRLNKGAGETDKVFTKLKGTFRKTEDQTKDTGDAFSNARDDASHLEDAVKDLSDSLYNSLHDWADVTTDVDSLKGKIADTTQRLREAQDELHKLEAIKHPTAAQQEDMVIAKGKVADLRNQILNYRIDLSKLDKTTLKGLIDQLAQVQYRTDKIGDEARQALDAFRKMQLALNGMPGYTGDPGYAPRAPVQAPAVQIKGVSPAEITDMVERGLYFKLQRSPIGPGRT